MFGNSDDGNVEPNQAALQKLRGQVQSIATKVNAKAKNLQVQESLLRQGQIPSYNARDVEKNLARSLGPILAPGNLGDINKIIWPYWFSTHLQPGAEVLSSASNPTLQTGFTVTQEAAFVLMSYSKAVYLVNDGLWVYLDPNDESSNVNSAPGLTFTLRDASSSRQFFNTPMNLAAQANPRFPTKLPRPVMMLPNQEMQVQFNNSHPSNEYVPFLTFFGYRMRVEDAQNFLGLVFG